MTTEHTPIWMERDGPAFKLYRSLAAKEHFATFKREKDAAEYVSAVNSFDAMKAALSAALSQDPANWREIGHAALALAEKGEK